MNPDRLDWRPAGADDRPAIRRILTQAFADYGIDLPQDYSFEDVEDIQRSYVDAGGAFMVLTRADRPIGFFGLVPAGGLRMALKRLYLHAGDRGSGLGHRLIRRALQTARDMGFGAIHLETTSKFKEAVGLYARHGFVADPDANLSAGHDLALVKVL